MLVFCRAQRSSLWGCGLLQLLAWQAATWHKLSKPPRPKTPRAADSNPVLHSWRSALLAQRHDTVNITALSPMFYTPACTYTTACRSQRKVEADTRSERKLTTTGKMRAPGMTGMTKSVSLYSVRRRFPSLLPWRSRPLAEANMPRRPGLLWLGFAPRAACTTRNGVSPADG